jgi:hypothetical protein
MMHAPPNDPHPFLAGKKRRCLKEDASRGLSYLAILAIVLIHGEEV